ncbi:GNAT family N-acetyltransferase [Actinoplanes sp. NPDC051633]|uniref:GNAT family N-acetyltransferase n=1 Tax=Actinoplanes sp. NPDC051633 TaxID=3155670 RepID=UPI0034128753
MTELRTDRLLLREWRDDDLDPWAAMNADPQVREFLGGPITRAGAAASIARYRAGCAARGWGWWAVEVAGSGEFIGFAGLDPIAEGAPVSGVEVGWRLARDAWGHGYATEAARPCLAYGFERLDLPEILAIADPGNVRSHAVMRRLGMVHDPTADFEDEDGKKVVWRIERARWSDDR